MLDWNLRTEDFECSLDNKDSAGLSYLLCTAEKQSKGRQHITSWWEGVRHTEGRYLLGR